MQRKTDGNENSSESSVGFRLRTLPWKKILILTAAFVLAVVLLLICIIWYLIASAPDIDTITVSPVESATYICDQDGTYLRKLTLASSNRDIVSLEEIPEHLQQAVIAIEDERFYEHGGIDVRGIARAFVNGIVHGSFSEGASTITQQLIKNNVFTEWTQENSFADRFSRKIQEQYLALQLEDRISKEEILEDYLNTINLGAGCYGVQAASRRYFAKDVSELTLSEAAVLAAIPQNPSGYNPIRYPDANRKRQSLIFDYMERQGYITSDEKEAALADDVYARIQSNEQANTESNAYSYYEDALIDQVIDLLVTEKGYSSEQAYRAVYSGGLRIFSAQDQALQQICDEEFQNPANFPDGTQYGVDYALSVADPNGLVTHYGTDALRSYVREHLNGSFDLVCSTPEEAEEYAASFQSYVLETYREKYADETEAADSAGQAETPYAEVLGERLSLSPQPQASLVLIDQHTGLVRAIVGGRGEKTASLTLNRATDTVRQPGSTFKILTAYAPALESFGKTLASLYENEPIEYEDGTPVSNWDITDYSGTATIREAITRSINVIAVKCITEITPRAGFECAQNLGISTLHETFDTGNGVSSDIIQPLALGGITQGVTNLELCGAYAAIANAGIYSEPKFFTKILDRHGEVIIDLTDGTSDSSQGSFGAARRVLSESTAFLLTDAMEDVVSSPSGTAYGSIQAAAQPVAGKTGTTSSYKDIWFVGYTPYYTCSIWGGYDNNQELPSGSTYHSYNKVLWSAIMSRIHSELPAAEFKQPDSVVSVELCSESHLPAVADGCPETYQEYFAVGTAPQEECTLHEPAPETEYITIYPGILDQLLNESESETESESEPESATQPESQSESPGPGGHESESSGSGPGESETTRPGESETMRPGESETVRPGEGETLPSLPGSGEAPAESETADTSPVPDATISQDSTTPEVPDTTSFDDLIGRLLDNQQSP